jgi:hypothetical protein
VYVGHGGREVAVAQQIAHGERVHLHLGQQGAVGVAGRVRRGRLPLGQDGFVLDGAFVAHLHVGRVDAGLRGPRHHGLAGQAGDGGLEQGHEDGVAKLAVVLQAATDFLHRQAQLVELLVNSAVAVGTLEQVRGLRGEIGRVGGVARGLAHGPRLPYPHRKEDGPVAGAGHFAVEVVAKFGLGHGADGEWPAKVAPGASSVSTKKAPPMGEASSLAA